VAFRRGSDLIVYDTAAGQARRLEGVVLKGKYPVDNTEWAISPNGSQVALLDGQELTLLDLPAGTRRTVPGTPDSQRDAPGAWSPDGSLFAYGTKRDRPPGRANALGSLAGRGRAGRPDPVSRRYSGCVSRHQVAGPRHDPGQFRPPRPAASIQWHPVLCGQP
jgi:hypothetical protein